MDWVLIAIVFVVLFAVVLIAVGAGLRIIEAERKKKVSTILESANEAPVLETTLLHSRDGNRSKASAYLSQFPFHEKLQRMLDQADLDWSPERLILFMVIGGVAGSLIGLRITVPIVREFTALFFGALGAALPYLYVKRTRKKRLDAFEEQFPEALDFLARSMQAGHAFSVSLEMLASETADPLGREFRQVFNEQNLGAPIDVALRNLANRVPLLDVRFFVSAVMLQRETGGNLAEILTKLAYIIRQRFQLKRQVRAASAHGRLTAGVLTVVPILTFLGMSVTFPGYVESLADFKEGRIMIVFIFAGQLLGYLCIRRIIDIKV